MSSEQGLPGVQLSTWAALLAYADVCTFLGIQAVPRVLTQVTSMAVGHERDSILVTLPSVPHAMQFDFFSLEVEKMRPPVVPVGPHPSPSCTWSATP